jgi:hypothetical protein
LSANILHSSASSQWYTPPETIALVKKILGGYINIDPCSCALAQQVVGAARYYDGGENGSGLDLPWDGETSFWNVPYMREHGGVDAWTLTACQEFDAGMFEHGIGLINAEPGRKWFSRLWVFDVAFLKARIEFLEPTTQFLERALKKAGRVPPTAAELADPARVKAFAESLGRKEEFPGLVRGPSPSHANALVLQTNDRRKARDFEKILGPLADIVPAGTVRVAETEE